MSKIDIRHLRSTDVYSFEKSLTLVTHKYLWFQLQFWLEKQLIFVQYILESWHNALLFAPFSHSVESFNKPQWKLTALFDFLYSTTLWSIIFQFRFMSLMLFLYRHFSFLPRTWFCFFSLQLDIILEMKFSFPLSW